MDWPMFWLLIATAIWPIVVILAGLYIVEIFKSYLGV